MPLSPSEVYARTFRMHRGALLDLYAQLPDEQANFAAWEGGMSFLGLADHLAASGDRMLAVLRGQAPTPGPGETSPDLPAARERLQASTERALDAIGALSEQDLARRVPAFGGREMRVTALLDLLIGHEAHHKGQVWMMARMVGIKPPRYVKTD